LNGLIPGGLPTPPGAGSALANAQPTLILGTFQVITTKLDPGMIGSIISGASGLPNPAGGLIPAPNIPNVFK
jgi:hypothetical protein